jgi:hypothetical protein
VTSESAPTAGETVGTVTAKTYAGAALIGSGALRLVPVL